MTPTELRNVLVDMTDARRRLVAGLALLDLHRVNHHEIDAAAVGLDDLISRLSDWLDGAEIALALREGATS